MENINILYIDDNIDPHITKFLDSSIDITDVSISTNEYKFNIESDTYKTILENEEIKKADIILIDSRLFENSHTGVSKISGEEIKIIITKFFPFKNIIVISQNGTNESLGILGKYKHSKDLSPKEYYDSEWKNIIEKSIKEILIIRKINSQLNDNENIETIVKEKIENSIAGISQYEELSKDDIDNCIKTFLEIKEICENEGL